MGFENYNPVPQAQEDWYDGVKYRSKLESKTAQALDNIGMPFVYEPEGFKLSNGLWYRPDFWLSDVGQYVECKGYMTEADSAKIYGLVEDTSHPVVVLSYENAMMFTRFWNEPSGDVVTYTANIALVRCSCCGSLRFASMEDTYACPKCGAYEGDRFLEYMTDIESAQQLFVYGQSIVANKPIYKQIANEFNN